MCQLLLKLTTFLLFLFNNAFPLSSKYLIILVWPLLALFSSLHSVHLTTFKYMNFYLCPGLICHWFRFYTECSDWPLERTLLCLSTLLFALQETSVITVSACKVLYNWIWSMHLEFFLWFYIFSNVQHFMPISWSHARVSVFNVTNCI